MFKFIPGEVRHAWWPVRWAEATDDGGTVEQQIDMRFVLHGDAEYQTLTSDTAADYDERWKTLTGADREIAQRYARADFIREPAVDWRGITDSDGNPLPWDRDLLAGFLQRPGVSTAVITAHGQARAGARPNG